MSGFRLDAEGHAMSVLPAESCGLVVKGTYWPCRNIADNPSDEFQIHPTDYLTILAKGPIEAVVHSHPNGKPPSEPDKRACQQIGVPWYVWDVTSKQWWIIQPSSDDSGPTVSMTVTH